MGKDKENENLVVKSNELIQAASYNLTAEEQKLLCYVISKIKPTDKDFQEYTIPAAEFADLCGIDRRHIYRDFKRMMDSQYNKARWIQIGDDVTKFSVFVVPKYNEKAGSITVYLNPYLKKYLIGLSRNYTQYELWNILSLKSKYAIRLYELFKSYAYQHEIDFDIDTLKSLLCCENYKDYGNFRKRVITPAITEINERTNLTISFTTRRRGKGGKTKEIYFVIEQKHSLEAFAAYRRTVDAINKKERQVPGQMSIFELGVEDFE